MEWRKNKGKIIRIELNEKISTIVVFGLNSRITMYNFLKKLCFMRIKLKKHYCDSNREKWEGKTKRKEKCKSAKKTFHSNISFPHF